MKPVNPKVVADEPEQAGGLCNLCIILAEFDGPRSRSISVQVSGI
jgi:hypothetical protein